MSAIYVRLFHTFGAHVLKARLYLMQPSGEHVVRTSDCSKYSDIHMNRTLKPTTQLFILNDGAVTGKRQAASEASEEVATRACGPGSTA